jgi:hypothetical protein
VRGLSPGTKLLAARCECMHEHFHPITMLKNAEQSILIRCKHSQRGASCEDWKSAYRSFSSDVTAAILVYRNNEMAAILVYGTGISSFLFKYFVLFHHPTGATDHVSENDL